MNIKRIIFIFIYILTLHSCAEYKIDKKSQKIEKQYFSSSGFALIYEDDLFFKKIVNKKINNKNVSIMHNKLKKNTSVKIINPINSKTIVTKVSKKANYPGIFNVVISKKIASILNLDLNNPYVELIEVKKNKTFIAKKSNIFEEEKNVSGKAPVDEIKMDDITNNKNKNEGKKIEIYNFIILINDFFYQDSATNLKNQLLKKTKIDSISIKKIGNNRYRLLAGLFKTFIALKASYISLNNLGFNDLNIYKE